MISFVHKAIRGTHATFPSKGVEAPSIGSQNVFEAKCRVPHTIRISNNCTVGAGCTLVPDYQGPLDPNPNSESTEPSSTAEDQDPSRPSEKATSQTSVSMSADEIETLPDRTVVFGAEAKRRIWSGEGSGQARALHAKHLEYLRET